MQAATARRYKTWGVPGKAARRRRAALYHPIQQSQVGLLTRLTAGVWAAAMGPSYVKQVLLLAPCMIVLQCVASAETSFRPMPPFQPSERTCLAVHHDGAAAYWLNRCPYAVTVRWTDDGKCADWSCQDEIPPNTRSSAAISRHARWCECRGTLSTCRLQPDSC